MRSNGDAPPGARIRSRLNGLILKALAVDVGMPWIVGELVQLLWVCSSRSFGQAEYRLRHPTFITTYLYRLVEQGHVKLDGLKRRRQATLTHRGRRVLQALETLYGSAGQGGVPMTAAALRGEVGRIRHERLRRMTPTALIQRMREERDRLARRLPGPPKATVFVSYDVPRRENFRRRLIIAVLRGHGFTRVHQSLYVGPSGRLRAVLELLEPHGVLSHCRWGTLTVFKP